MPEKPKRLKTRGRLLWIALVIAATILHGCSVRDTELVGLVTAVKDGDTIEILKNGETERVRLQGIDCPEWQQDFGRKAKEFTADRCFDRRVTVRVLGRDRYGRILGEVILPEGASLNRELVRNGMAWWYFRYSDDEGLASLEREARRKKRGLWSMADPIPPWEFRKRKRQESQ